MLGDVPVGPGQQTEVGVLGARVPHLLAADHPAVAVALGGGGEAGQVRAGARLAEELAPRLLAGDRGGEEGPCTPSGPWARIVGAARAIPTPSGRPGASAAASAAATTPSASGGGRGHPTGAGHDGTAQPDASGLDAVEKGPVGIPVVGDPGGDGGVEVVGRAAPIISEPATLSC